MPHRKCKQIVNNLNFTLSRRRKKPLPLDKPRKRVYNVVNDAININFSRAKAAGHGKSACKKRPQIRRFRNAAAGFFDRKIRPQASRHPSPAPFPFSVHLNFFRYYLNISAPGRFPGPIHSSEICLEGLRSNGSEGYLWALPGYLSSFRRNFLRLAQTGRENCPPFLLPHGEFKLFHSLSVPIQNSIHTRRRCQPSWIPQP